MFGPVTAQLAAFRPREVPPSWARKIYLPRASRRGSDAAPDTNRRGRRRRRGEASGDSTRPVAPTPLLSGEHEPRGGANRRAKTDKLARAIVAKEPTPRLPTRRRVALRARSSAAAASTTSGGWYRPLFYSYSSDTRRPRRGHPGKRIRKLDQVFHLRDGDVRQSRGERDALAPAPATHLSAPSTSFWRPRR